LDDQCVCTRCVGHTDIAVFKCGICQAKAELYKLWALMTIECSASSCWSLTWCDSCTSRRNLT
jgi:hypothetical protein